MREMILREQTIAGSDTVSITVAVSEREFFFRYRPPEPSKSALNICVALRMQRQIGAAILPFAQHFEGSTVFLPFKSDLLLSVEVRAGQIVRFLRRWERWRWSEREQTQAFEITQENGEFVFRIPRPLAGAAKKIDFAIYARDPNANNGWGWFWGCSDRSVASGLGDKYISHFHQLDLDSVRGPLATLHGRHRPDKAR